MTRAILRNVDTEDLWLRNWHDNSEGCRYGSFAVKELAEIFLRAISMDDFWV